MVNSAWKRKNWENRKQKYTIMLLPFILASPKINSEATEVHGRKAMTRYYQMHTVWNGLKTLNFGGRVNAVCLMLRCVHVPPVESLMSFLVIHSHAVSDFLSLCWWPISSLCCHLFSWPAVQLHLLHSRAGMFARFGLHHALLLIFPLPSPFT